MTKQKQLPPYEPVAPYYRERYSDVPGLAENLDQYMAVWEGADVLGKQHWDEMNAWADHHQHRALAVDLLEHLRTEPKWDEREEYQDLTIQYLAYLIGDPVLTHFLGYPLEDSPYITPDPQPDGGA